MDTSSGFFIGAVIIGAVLVFLVVLCIGAACVGSGRASRREERDEARRLRDL